MFGKRLLALHNVAFLFTIMRDARAALRDGTFGAWSDQWVTRYRATKSIG
jgi:queuine/archaeosine tRNA-ribosyltransferase